jgi:ABC-type microcin C transport system permease subunit YejE
MYSPQYFVLAILATRMHHNLWQIAGLGLVRSWTKQIGYSMTVRRVLEL